MPRPALRHALASLLMAAVGAPAQASSTASSVASEGASASVGSLSASVEGSSQSSTGGRVAQGEYRVTEIAQAPQRPGLLRVALQGEAGAFALWLPAPALQQGGLAVGQVVTARERDFGLEFSAGQPRKAFFLVLHDEALPDLRTRPVVM